MLYVLKNKDGKYLSKGKFIGVNIEEATKLDKEKARKYLYAFNILSKKLNIVIETVNIEEDK